MSVEGAGETPQEGEDALPGARWLFSSCFRCTLASSSVPPLQVQSLRLLCKLTAPRSLETSSHSPAEEHTGHSGFVLPGQHCSLPSCALEVCFLLTWALWSSPAGPSSGLQPHLWHPSHGGGALSCKVLSFLSFPPTALGYYLFKDFFFFNFYHFLKGFIEFVTMLLLFYAFWVFFFFFGHGACAILTLQGGMELTPTPALEDSPSTTGWPGKLHRALFRVLGSCL